jgi:hypothetical protein
VTTEQDLREENAALKQGMVDGIQEAIRQVRKLEAELDALKAALEDIAVDGCFCHHPERAHGIRCPKQIARQALKELEEK